MVVINIKDHIINITSLNTMLFKFTHPPHFLRIVVQYDICHRVLTFFLLWF